ncbi:MAG TPA: hypothetical protein VF236_06630 [Gaiellaceae bacterium]
MRAVAAVLAALALVPAAVGGATPDGLASGLRGVVMRGPTNPICDDREPCEEPAAGVILRFARAGHVVARVKTSPNGLYRVRLRPGRYTVTTPRRVAGLMPRVVRVPVRRFARVDFQLDTGMQ